MKNRSALAVVLPTVFLDLVGFGIVIPILPLWAASYHPHPVVLGLLMASYSFFQFLAAPLLGRLSDRIGRRPVLLISLAGSIGSYLLFAFADSVPLILLSRVLAGACGGNLAAAQAVIGDIYPPENRSRGMGLVGAALGLGFVVGPALGGFLVEYGHRWPGYGAAALSACAFLLALALLPETRPETAQEERPKTSRFAGIRSGLGSRLGPAYLVSFLAIFAFAGFESTFSQFLEGRFGMGPRQVSTCFAFVGVMMVLVQGGLVGALAKRFREATLATAGIVLTALGLFAVPILPTEAFLWPALALLALGTGLTNPSLSGFVSRSSGADEQGASLGVLQSMGALGRIGGPIAGQWLFGSVGRAVPYRVGAALLVVAVFVLLPTARRTETVA